MKYTAQVQLTPKLHMGSLQHFWHIDQVTDSGTFTVQHGYAKRIDDAYTALHLASYKFIG